MNGQLFEAQHEAFMLLAEKEMLAFERQERELRQQERLERVKLKFPGLLKALDSQPVSLTAN